MDNAGRPPDQAACQPYPRRTPVLPRRRRGKEVIMAMDNERPLLPGPVKQARAERPTSVMKLADKEKEFEEWRQSLKGRDALRANVWDTLDRGACRTGREQSDIIMQTLRQFSQQEK